MNRAPLTPQYILREGDSDCNLADQHENLLPGQSIMACPTLHRKAAQPPPPIRLIPGSREAIPSIGLLKTG